MIMKIYTSLLAGFVAFTAASFVFPQQPRIIGHWVAHYRNGSASYADFNEDGTCKSYTFDGKPLVNATYKVGNGTLSINDKQGCGDDYWGKYSLTFYGRDSVLFTAVDDSCTPRRTSIDGGNLSRVKQ